MINFPNFIVMYPAGHVTQADGPAALHVPVQVPEFSYSPAGHVTQSDDVAPSHVTQLGSHPETII